MVAIVRMLVTGAGGFIGHHLVKRLKAIGHWVRGVDIRMPGWEPTVADEFVIGDLRYYDSCLRSVSGIDSVFGLAADMGGIGYISAHHARIARNNALINLNMLEAASSEGVDRYVYTSSACVYPARDQDTTAPPNLREDMAMPADPERGYGWEKLFTEQMCSYYAEGGLRTCVVRLHNVYGPMGAFSGGREKAPAALCRKVAEQPDGGTIEIWGDGQQTRSFCYVDDCVEGLARLEESGFAGPVNLGTEEMVTINQLAMCVATAAGKRISLSYSPGMPQGVRGRNSDNTLLRDVLDWEPRTPLSVGIARTYGWVRKQVEGAHT
jgi:GDP-D-mannose 3',5'-epimerase